MRTTRGRGAGGPRRTAGEEAGRRGELIRASARLFREKGFDATSVRDIAAAAGMQSGSWVYHFRTKQDILAAVMEEGLEQALGRIESIAALDLPPREKFAALVRAHLDTILGPGQDFIPVLLYEWRSLDRAHLPRVLAPQRRYERIWDQVIRELQAGGDWAEPGKVDRLLMFGALNWIARWYRPRGGLGIEELAAECVRFFLRAPRTQVAKTRGGGRRARRR